MFWAVFPVFPARVAYPPAIVNAVIDALKPWEISHIDMPLLAERVWRAIRDAELTPRLGGPTPGTSM